MLGLVDPYLKLGRAKVHLDALDILLQDFSGEGKAYAFTCYDDPKTERHSLKTLMFEVPDPITLTVGDALYNMRSSLDQLVWSLAKRPGKLIDPEGTQFPIVERNNTKHRKRIADLTVGVPPLAIDEIKSLQPYHRRAAFKSHPLWRLNAMGNLDKHRRIPANGSELLVHFPKAIEGMLTMEAVEDGIIASVPLAYKDQLQMHPSVTFKVNFGGNASGLTEDRDGLWEIYKFVSDCVLPKFIRFFK
jgi:hypothetical protein